MIFRKTFHYLIWGVFFFDGLIDAFGFFPGPMRFLALGSISILAGLTIIRIKVKLPFVMPVFLLGCVTLISGSLVHDFGITSNFYFFRILILAQYLYLIVIVNEKSDHLIRSVFHLVLFLYLIQIPAGIIKFILVGHTEMFIGTVSFKEGSMTTLISLIGSAFVFARYLYSHQKKYLVLLFFFLLFSQIGGKRAIVIYLPILIFLMYYQYGKLLNISLNRKVQYALMSVIILVVGLYAVVRLNPSLNPEKQIGGSFDPEYAVDFIEEYSFEERDRYSYSRPQALLYMLNYLLSQDALTILFGEGAGKLTYASGLDREYNPIEYYYGIRYGARTGIIWIFLQVGLAGVLLYLYILYRMIKHVMSHPHKSYHQLAFYGIWLTLIMDLFTYSSVSLNYFVINGTLFGYFGFFYRDRVMNRNLLSTV